MKTQKQYPISLDESKKAQRHVYKHLIPTQLTRYEGLSQLIDADIHVKHENHNPTGSFKVRGGINLMHHLKQSNVNGVVTFSTGNHGYSVGYTASWFGIHATVIVPEGTNPAKKRNIISTGAELIEAGKTFEEASKMVEEIVAEKGYYFVHPANEPHLINGVGTEFLEILEELPDMDAIIIPLGAGSEAAAAVTVLQTINPDIEIYAVQAEQSSAACLSWKTGQIQSGPNTTFAGGFATGTGYEIPFSIYKNALSDFILLPETEIYEGIALAAYYTQNYLEGAGAATIMAALRLKKRLQGKKVVLQYSGCNASTEEIQKAYNHPFFTNGYTHL
jgi:threonine dehydratase